MEKKELIHIFIPKHIKLGKEDTEEVLKKYNLSKKQLPKISIKDPALSHMEAEKGDIIQIERDSPTCGKSIFYRVVVN